MKERTPEEINQLVAEKIMGWIPKPCNLEETGGEVIYYDDGYVECPCCKGYKHIDEFKHGIIPPYNYSADMNAAWLVLQEMVRRQLQREDPACGKNDKHFIAFATHLLSVEYDYLEPSDLTCEHLEIYPGWKTVTIASTWTPENICNAALKAIGAI